MKPLIAISFACLILTSCKSRDEEPPKPVASVAISRVVTADVPLVVSAPASIFGKSEAHLSARITATVQRVLVHKGESVRAGQILATLDQRDLIAQRADAVAATSSASASLQRVQNGTVPAQLTQARGEATAKAASLQLAQKIYEHRKNLFQQGAISQRELQTSEANLIQAKADAEAAQKNLEVLETRTSVDDVRLAQGSLEQAKAREAIANADLSFSEIRSPFDGTVTDQMVYPGDLASPGTQMFTVMDLSYAVARAQVDADSAGSIKVGQACSFVLHDVQNNSPNGRITAVNQAVDPSRRTIEVWCEIPNHGGALKAGLFGKVEISLGIARAAVVIPSSAIEMNEGSTQGKVYVVDASGTAHQRDVEAEPLDDGRVRIIRGLQAGEKIIMTGEYGLPDGTAVTPTGAAQ